MLKRMTAKVGSAAVAGGLAFGGLALAAPAGAQAAVHGGTASAAVATPAGSFHVPVVPYPFSGAWNTPFSLYSLGQIPAGTIGYQVVLTLPGDEQDYDPPIGSTLILRSDSLGNLSVPVTPGTTTIPDPIPAVDFFASGLGGFISGAGDYSLAIKFYGSTSLTGVWWTEIHFDGPASADPNWEWDPTAGGL